MAVDFRRFANSINRLLYIINTWRVYRECNILLAPIITRGLAYSSEENGPRTKESTSKKKKKKKE